MTGRIAFIGVRGVVSSLLRRVGIFNKLSSRMVEALESPQEKRDRIMGGIVRKFNEDRMLAGAEPVRFRLNRNMRRAMLVRKRRREMQELSRRRNWGLI